MVAVVVLILAAPVVARSAISLLTAESTTPIEWVPASFLPRQAYDRFTKEFESGDVVVASWPGCTIGAAGLERFIAAATGPTPPCDASGNPWFESVTSGTQVVEGLVAEPLSLDRAVAIKRLEGVIIGPDGQQTCLVIGFTRAGLIDRRRATTWIRDTLRATATTQDDDVHLAGPVIDNVSVDEASAESLRVYGGPAALLILVLAWWSLGSLGYAVIVFILALLCVGGCFTSLAAWGDRMNPVLIVLPLLVLTLGVSGGIHLLNYLREASRSEKDPERAAWRAIAAGWWPCLLSAGTTALGLASLVVSELEPIRVFGFHGAVGVLLTPLALFVVVPGIFSRWPLQHRPEEPSRRRFAHRLAAMTIDHATGIIAVTVVVLVAGGIGVSGIRTSVSIETLFTPESRVIRDSRWLEEHLGPLAPIEVVLRFDDDSVIRPAERLDMVREVGQALMTIPGVTGVASAAMFMPDAIPSSAARAAARKAVIARKLMGVLAGLSDIRIVRAIEGEQLWRVTARTSALAGIDYGRLLEHMREHVAPILEAHGGLTRGVRADYTGVMPLINAIQNALLHDFFTSFVSACLVISVVMMLVQASLIDGIVAMIPNILPMILLFGILGWAGAALDIGSVMTASIALGMAVDGTFHFLTFFRRALRQESAGPNESGHTARGRAVHAAFRHSAAAVTQSAVICGLGILAFAGSSFAPSRRFSWMLAVLVGMALVGDLIVLPALLASRLGRWFTPR
jgi:predicted RND superfamily exporter protein